MSIPKVIHYCWFGGNKKGELIERCIKSWGETNPSFTIREWNEETFPVEKYPFTKQMHREKKWAFVADYARLVILYEHGGIYLDTDMELIRDLSPLIETDLLLGKESEDFVSCGMIGSSPHHPFIKTFIDEYHKPSFKLEPNPVILTRLFTTVQDLSRVTVLDPIAFYPYTSDTIKNYSKENVSEKTYGVHLWNYSWGHPLNKFFKKIGIYSFGKKMIEILGIKKLLKRLLGFV